MSSMIGGYTPSVIHELANATGARACSTAAVVRSVLGAKEHWKTFRGEFRMAFRRLQMACRHAIASMREKFGCRIYTSAIL